MGACLMTSNHQRGENAAISAPPNLRDQIKAQIVQRPDIQIPKMIEENKEKSLILASNESVKLNINDRTLYTSSRIIQSNSSLTDVDLNESGKRTLKPVILTGQAISSIKNTSWSAKQQTSNQLALSSDSGVQRNDHQAPQVQTPFNRLYQPPGNMIGQGLREQDNNLILSTKSAQQPIKLHAIKFKNGSTYLGEWVQAKRHGKGTLFWKDGSRYQGQWAQNFSQGHGKLIYNQNQYYQGSFVRNCRHGQGKFISFNVIYEGQWVDDKYQGQGKQSWGNQQSFYQGKWMNGCKHGQGFLCFQDGSYYKGSFNSNQIHGYGVYSWFDSRTYVGCWEHNRMAGKGILKWKNGLMYEGEFQNDKMHGFGRLVQPNGSFYQGKFEFGRKHGKGIQTDMEGKNKQVQYYMGRKLRAGQNLRYFKKKMKNQEQNLHGSTY